MYIVIHTESTTSVKENEARRLADVIWALPYAGKLTCIIVEKLKGERYCVVGDPPATKAASELPAPRRRVIDNPCDRCGFNVLSFSGDGDPLPQHSSERDCFRAACDAATEMAREEIRKALGGDKK